MTTHYDTNPPAPPNTVDDRERVFLGTSFLPDVDFTFAGRRGPYTWVDAAPGATVEQVIALALEDFHADYVNHHPEDVTVWRLGKVVAVLRGLADGRREVLVLEGRKVDRRIYPPNRYWAERDAEEAAAKYEGGMK